LANIDDDDVAPITSAPSTATVPTAAGATAAAVVATSAAAVLAAETRARTASMQSATKAETLKAEAIMAKADPVSQSVKREEPAPMPAVADAKTAEADDYNGQFKPSPRPSDKDLKSRYIGLASNNVPTLSADQLPPRSRTASGSSQPSRRAVSSPLSPTATGANGTSPLGPGRAAAPAPIETRPRVVSHPRVNGIASEAAVEAEAVSSPTKSVHSVTSNSSIMDRPRPKIKPEISMTALLKHPRVVISLLPFININTFLNLLGSDDEVRKYITGEMVGRWVMREWCVTIDRERGRSWPGLTVWEGFRKCLK